MVAMGITTLTLLMIMPTIPLGLERLREIKKREVGIWSAESKIEDLRRKEFKYVSTFGKSKFGLNPEGVATRVTINDESDTLKHILVETAWRNNRTGTFELKQSMESYISEYHTIWRNLE